MSTFAIALDHPSTILNIGSRGSAPEFNDIRQALADVRKKSLGAASTPQSLAYVSLERVFAVASHDDWDGYGARAITRITYNNARALLSELPVWLPAPEIVPESDGEIAIEWASDTGQVFSISIGPAGEMNFAGLFGKGAERHGVEPFEGSLSPDILGYITRVAGAGKHRRAA